MDTDYNGIMLNYNGSMSSLKGFPECYWNPLTFPVFSILRPGFSSGRHQKLRAGFDPFICSMLEALEVLLVLLGHEVTPGRGCLEVLSIYVHEEAWPHTPSL